jgi:hypothetical protein
MYESFLKIIKNDVFRPKYSGKGGCCDYRSVSIDLDCFLRCLTYFDHPLKVFKNR